HGQGLKRLSTPRIHPKPLSSVYCILPRKTASHFCWKCSMQAAAAERLPKIIPFCLKDRDQFSPLLTRALSPFLSFVEVVLASALCPKSVPPMWPPASVCSTTFLMFFSISCLSVLVLRKSPS